MPVITQETLDPATLGGIHKSKTSAHPIVKKYMDEIQAGATFPPIEVEVRQNGIESMLWVLDGEKRAAAHKELKLDVVANVARETAPMRIPCAAMIARRNVHKRLRKKKAEQKKKGPQ
jgi:hypothetical protein